MQISSLDGHDYINHVRSNDMDSDVYVFQYETPLGSGIGHVAVNVFVDVWKDCRYAIFTTPTGHASGWHDDPEYRFI